MEICGNDFLPCPHKDAEFLFYEVYMKKFLAFFAACIAAALCLFVVACSDKEPVKADENTVAITATDSSFVFGEKSLKDFMDHLQKSEKLAYKISDGMVTEINGKANTTSSYWMLYTSDTENANNEWGTLEYEGEVYGSATLGAESLKAKEGCIYIWSYQTF